MSTRLFARLFGRKKITTGTLADEIARHEGALAEAGSRLEAAARDRETALEAGDKEALRAAASAAVDAEQDVEIAESALTTLKAEHGRHLAADRREALRLEAASHQRAASILSDRIRREYPEAAGKLSRLVADLQAYGRRSGELQEQARAVGERIEVSDPQDFRHGRQEWRLTYPSPDGGSVIQCTVTDAPSGTVVWIDGEPTPARDGVNVWPRRRDWARDLTSIGPLPGLMAGDPPLYSAPEEPVRFSNSPIPDSAGTR